MSRIANFRRVAMNSTLLFTANKYVVFGLQLVRGVLVAKFLGPYGFGVWGFATLLQQYLQFANLGLPYAVNVQLSTEAMDHPEKRKPILNVAFTMIILIATLLALVGLGTQILTPTLFEKYGFSQFAGIVGIVAGLFQVQLLLTFVYRQYGKLSRIAASDMLGAFLPLMAALAFRDEALIMALLYSLALAEIISVIIFMIRPPFEISLSLNPRYMQSLLRVGIPLLVYNFSFVLIAIIARTIISVFYSVETLGFYTLASSLSAISLLGVSAVAWVVFPSLLAQTREGVSDAVVERTIAKVNDTYVIAVFLTVYVTILVLPVFFAFLPQYKPAEPVLVVLLLSEALFSISFAYNIVAISRGKQLVVAGASLTAVAVVAGLGLLVALLKLDFVWISMAVLAGAFVYMVLQVRIGSRLLNLGRVQKGHLSGILPWSSIAGILLFLLGAMSGYQFLLGGFGLFVFTLGSLRQLKQFWCFALQKVGIA